MRVPLVTVPVNIRSKPNTKTCAQKRQQRKCNWKLNAIMYRVGLGSKEAAPKCVCVCGTHVEPKCVHFTSVFFNKNFLDDFDEEKEGNDEEYKSYVMAQKVNIISKIIIQTIISYDSNI